MCYTCYMSPKGTIALGFLALATSAVAGTFGYAYSKEAAAHQAAAVALATMESKNAELESLLATTKSSLAQVLTDYDQAALELAGEKERNAAFEGEIRSIAKTVGVLDKLSKTDKELLQKYSKTFFLNEHYAPEQLSKIDASWLAKGIDDTEHFHTNALPFLERMLARAAEEDISLTIVSAYRSGDEQRALKSAYSVQYGSGANTFSADQGYSEHQLGTTIDFSTAALAGKINGFDTTPAFIWMQKNAHKYGFILSYPKGNSYYMYEPWHWRFVGEELATDLYESKKMFADLEQREIDSYLVDIFEH